MAGFLDFAVDASVANSYWLSRRSLDDPIMARFEFLICLLKPTQREQLVFAAKNAWTAARGDEDHRWDANKIWSCLGVTSAAIGSLLLVVGIITYSFALLMIRRTEGSKKDAPILRDLITWFAILAIVFSFCGIMPTFDREIATSSRDLHCSGGRRPCNRLRLVGLENRQICDPPRSSAGPG